jgi:hypothetical protein
MRPHLRHPIAHHYALPSASSCGHPAHVGTCPNCQRVSAAKLQAQNALASAIGKTARVV